MCKCGGKEEGKEKRIRAYDGSLEKKEGFFFHVVSSTKFFFERENLFSGKGIAINVLGPENKRSKEEEVCFFLLSFSDDDKT